MLPLERPGRIHVAFDDHRLVSNAGLLLPSTLAQHLGLGELVVISSISTARWGGPTPATR